MPPKFKNFFNYLVSCIFSNQFRVTMPKFDDYCIQTFSIPKPILNYMLDSLDGKLLKKFHKSCKYFYVKMPYAIFEYFGTDNVERKIYGYNGVFLVNEAFVNSRERNLWLMGGLGLRGPLNVPKFIRKIVRCDIYELGVSCCLTIEELKFLTESGNIKGIALYADTAFNPENIFLPPEDIFPLVPRALNVCLYNFTVTKHTMQKLLKHEHQVKIEQLLWHQIDQVIETKLICKFLEKNLMAKGYAAIRFKDEDYNEIFAVEIYEIIRLWEPKEKIPTNFPNLHVKVF